jgi:hypothetical protein
MHQPADTERFAGFLQLDQPQPVAMARVAVDRTLADIADGVVERAHTASPILAMNDVLEHSEKRASLRPLRAA